MWEQVSAANPAQQDWAGSCLSFSSHAFNVPDLYSCAWDAWSNSIQHPDWNMPEGVAHPVWFSHWGTYGEPPVYKNWGHVVVRMTDGRFMSSPGQGYGQAWFDSIAQVESWFNCQYVGWSEDINGARVIQWSDPKPVLEDDFMYSTVRYPDGWVGLWNMATGSLVHVETINDLQKIDATLPGYAFANAAEFEAFKNKYKFALPAADLSGIEINVDAIAAAVASKLTVGCDCGCGVPKPADTTSKVEILSAIEANYPEDTK